jgi:8-oxo-dGTP pyrophosphatase MutT (NUDIX family)
MNDSKDSINPQSDLSSSHPDPNPPLQPDSTLAQESHTSQNKEALSETSLQTSIQIHIPSHLQSFAIPLSQFRAQRSQSEYRILVVGACIFSTRSPPFSFIPVNTSNADRATSEDASTDINEKEFPEPHILLIQRVGKDSMANKWEIPGGGIDDTDPTILHGLAREVFEETGLHLTRVVDLIEMQECLWRRGKYCKWSFEIEVAEIPPPHRSHTPHQHDEKPADGVKDLASIPIILDPEEHQSFAWVTEDKVNEYSITTKEQKWVIEKSLGIRNGTS